MPEHEGPARPVYDHTEDEQPRPAGRRRRQVADWGVGEELFDGMPGRRFERRGDDHRIPRGGADDGRRTIVISDNEPAPAEAPPEPVDEEFTSREDALRAREEHDAVWGGDEPFAETRYDDPPPVEREIEAAEPPPSRPVADGIVRGGVEGRRTVKIGGRPAEFHSAPRRPSRTVHERVGPRPDRIAAWAFALGILLILIAIATASI
jgi:hypothetical protein